MKKTYGVILAVIGYMILFCYAEGWGADWKLYSQTPEALYYFDVRSVIPSQAKTISVQVKLNFTDKGVIEMVEQFGKDYQNISYELDQYEITCADKQFRVSSVTCYSKNGGILLRVSREGAQWVPVPPDSTSESLWKLLCQ
ncbi:MAG TPA: surface-adhesin E family protein [Thermodesulfobacteriota bacterium]|nr:surface-adhesin E family protein [Thermodesulfobacteriota bacterium]